MLDRRGLLKAVCGFPAGLAGMSLPSPVSAMQEDGPGSIRWMFTAEEPGLGGLLVQDDALYAASDARVYALEARSGAEIWRFAMEDIERANSTPLSLGASTIYAGKASRYSVTVYAIDASSGTERWSFEADSVSSFAPIEVDGTVYVGKSGHAICAMDPLTGAEYWRFTTGDSVTESPLLFADTLYVGCFDSHLYALDATSGTELWRFSAGDRVSTPQAVVDGVIHVGGSDAQVYALDAATGSEIWRFASTAPVYSAPIVANGTVYVRDGDFTIHALDVTTGGERWRFSLPAQLFHSHPVEYAGIAYVGSYDGHVYALDAATGIERWRFGVQGSVSTTPAVVDGTLYVSDNNSYFYALDAESGIERWRLDRYDLGYCMPTAVADTICLCGGPGVFAVVAEPPRSPSPVVGGNAVTLVETPLRAAPLASGQVIATLPQGIEVTVTGESVDTDGVTWWPVLTADGTAGWVDGSALTRT